MTAKTSAQKYSGGNTGPLRSRNYAFTKWTPDWDPKIFFSDKNFRTEQIIYLCVGDEICPDTKRKHWQGVICFKNAKSRNSCLNIFGDHEMHVESCIGSIKQNIHYCTKDKNFQTFGTPPKQGERTDLKVIKDQIMSGTKVEEILLDEPMVYHQYGRTLDKLEDLYLRKQYRTEMTKGIWLHGETGTGKSHEAFQNFTPETHYVLPNDNGWWDGYKGQETLIINDFRGDIPYNQLLQLVDKWPMNVKRRNREPMPFTSKTVIITSSLRPDQIYNQRNKEDSIGQLLRRFTIKELKR